MNRHTLAELEALQTLCVGQADDLKIEEPDRRVWLARTGIADGEPCDHKVTIEVRDHDGRWHEAVTYEAGA